MKETGLYMRAGKEKLSYFEFEKLLGVVEGDLDYWIISGPI